MQKNQYIGVFDSGIGGISIWKEIVQLLPLESTIYLADSKHAPYGGKSQEEITQLCIKNTEILLQLGAKIIVVACNTATTNAIDYLRANYNVPFIGIEPAIKPAALQSKNKSIGILATKGTLNSRLFSTTSQRYTKEIDTIEVIGTGLVPLIEQGKIDSDETKKLLINYLAPMIEANIDYLVLGCSHYPFLLPILKELLPKQVTIIDSGEAVAKQTRAILEQEKTIKTEALQPVKHHIYSNNVIDVLEAIIIRFRESGHIPQKTAIEVSYKDF
ncbi:glutamate racemase [Dokdonia pacifica]|uniref:Glutamate racemase n=1 Tax=Dokdonia pacifica TaxID=1627892 RepID=A0A238VQW6_9FLAO|nr:glutamate racemase [Dokdonia pacifica]GGG18829.1 glutamate racemase [Dokdonia pacifica]SNR36544.1 glutamate racemase [Dokdonia pacifica]